MLGATNRKATVTAAMSHTSSTVSPPCQLLPYVSQMRQLFFSRCLVVHVADGSRLASWRAVFEFHGEFGSGEARRILPKATCNAMDCAMVICSRK